MNNGTKTGTRCREDKKGQDNIERNERMNDLAAGIGGKGDTQNKRDLFQKKQGGGGAKQRGGREVSWEEGC